MIIMKEKKKNTKKKEKEDQGNIFSRTKPRDEAFLSFSLFLFLFLFLSVEKGSQE